jgi:hypothetical protein
VERLHAGGKIKNISVLRSPIVKINAHPHDAISLINERHYEMMTAVENKTLLVHHQRAWALSVD